VRDAAQRKLHLPNAKQEVLDRYRHMALYVSTCFLFEYYVYMSMLLSLLVSHSS